MGGRAGHLERDARADEAGHVHPTAEYTVATGAGDTPPGSFLGLFRYATTFGWVLIGIATLCAMITGYC